MNNYSFSFLFLLSTVLIASPSTIQYSRASTPEIDRAVSDFVSDTGLNSASWAFSAVNISLAQDIAGVNTDVALIPASTQKVVTTLTALALLGGEYRFETLLQYDGKIVQNSLNGNLYIKGSGDPTLGAVQMHDSLHINRVFEKWVKALKASGIKKIKGDIVADGSRFDKHMVPPKWMWEDIGNYYGAGAHALTIHENMYTVFFEPGRREGEPARVINTDPEIPEMKFTNDVSTGPRGSGDRVYIYGVPRQHTRWLTGTVPLGQSNFSVRGSMPDPGMFLATSFKSYLQQNGIEVEGESQVKDTHSNSSGQVDRIVISRWNSPPLSAIVKRTNLSSVNTYAENLIKTLGAIYEDEGSFSAGASVINKFWQEKGINVAGLRIHDGSGLSSFNNLTAGQLTQMLVYAAGDESLFNDLTQGFPVAGESGSLARLFPGTRSRGVLMAKSGFLSNVRAYSGYTRNSNNELIAFTLIVNNYSGQGIHIRNNMVKLMDALSQ